MDPESGWLGGYCGGELLDVFVPVWKLIFGELAEIIGVLKNETKINSLNWFFIKNIQILHSQNECDAFNKKLYHKITT